MKEDVVVVGAGLCGLLEAWRRRQQEPDRTVRVVDRAPEAGGQTRTLRSEGFSCELGPQMYRDGPRLRGILQELELAGSLLPAQAELRWTPPAPDVVRFLVRSLEGDGDAEPAGAGWCTLATGTEDLVQALRRRLATSLWLGRAARAVERDERGGWRVQLAGGGTLACRELVLATPPNAAGELLHTAAGELADELFALTSLSVTNVYLGFPDDALGGTLAGGGFVVQDARDNPFLAAVFVNHLFAGRATRGRFLVRIVLDGELLPRDRDPAGIARAAEQALRGYTGLAAPLTFWRVVHNHDVVPRGGAGNRTHAQKIAALLAKEPALRWQVS